MAEGPLRDSIASLVCGAVVAVAEDVASVQAPDGTLVAAMRLGPGLVQGVDRDGALCVQWLDAAITTWVAAADVQPVGAGRRLVSVWRRDGQGRRTLLGHRWAALQHHWTVERLPRSVIRVVQAEGPCWTFHFNPLTHEVDPPWSAAPNDGAAEAVVTVDVALGTLHHFAAW